MAEQGAEWDQDHLSCSVCLQLLNEPVTLSCGHSYCRGCIEGSWDQDDQRGVYSCPLCRQTFQPRPVLKTSTLLAGLVEKLQTSGGPLKAAPPAKRYAGPGDVACDVCTGRRQIALRSCLVCRASYCETHLLPHRESPAFKKHALVDASERLQERICPQHDRVLDVFCRTDQKSICYLCSVDEHKGHHTVSAAAERTEKQRSAQAALDHSEKTFTEMIRSMERRRVEVRTLLTAQQKALLRPVEEVLRRLEQELAELRRSDQELKLICQTDDHVHFLQHYQSFTKPAVCSDLPNINALCLPSYFDGVREHVSNIKQKLQDMFDVESLCKISKNLTAEEVQPVVNTRERAFTDQNSPKPKTFDKPTLPVKAGPDLPRTRSDFLHYYRRLAFNPNTAHRELRLYNQNRAAEHVMQNMPYLDHPERFTDRWQVLCREGLTGRCYWEADWHGWIDAAVSYKDIKRTGEIHDYAFGYNDKSWSLECSDEGGCTFRHNKVETSIPDPQSSRLGLYLDHSAGTLSFYSVSADSSFVLLHRVQTTFTQPLYAGFVVSMLSSADLCDL